MTEALLIPYQTQILFQTAPPGTSVTSMPFAFNSSRIRSASAKFLAFLASPRAKIGRAHV